MKFPQATPSEVVSGGEEKEALSGRKGTGLFCSKNSKEGGGVGVCSRASSQDPPQLNFLDVVL